jgi:hypothetical protein
VFTYSVNATLAADEKLVLTIADDTGKQLRRLDLDKTPGLRRFTWNLRTDAPPPGAAQQGFGGFGRGGLQGTPVAPGRYRAAIGRLNGDKIAPYGQPVPFNVIPIELK